MVMASPVYLRDSALSISSDSFVEQSGNFKVLFRNSSPLSGPHCPRGAFAPAQSSALSATPPTENWHRAPRTPGRGPQRVLSPAPRLPIGSASYLLAPEIRKRSPPVPLKDGETGSGPAGRGGQDSPHSWTPPARAQLPTPRPRPAPETSQKRPQKPGGPGWGRAAQPCPPLRAPQPCPPLRAQASGC